MASDDKHATLNTVFSGTQAVAGLVTLGIAIWAVFFSTLPEMLERQLRTEVVEAKEAAIEIRRANGELALRGHQIEAENQRMTKEAATLQLKVSLLRSETDRAEREVAKAQQERALYAAEVSKTTISKVLAIVGYRLDQVEAVARICARYDEHREWLDAQTALKEAEVRWDQEPFDA